MSVGVVEAKVIGPEPRQGISAPRLRTSSAYCEWIRCGVHSEEEGPEMRACY